MNEVITISATIHNLGDDYLNPIFTENPQTYDGNWIVYDAGGMVFLDVVAYSLVERFIGKEVEVTGTIKRKGFRYRGEELKTVYVEKFSDIKLKN